MRDVKAIRLALSGAALSAALILAALAVASPADAETASSLGPLELFEGTKPALVAPSLLSFAQTIAAPSGTGFGRAIGGGSAGAKVSEVKITKPVDVATPRLSNATAKGTHFKRVVIDLYKAGSPLSLCLADAFPVSDSLAASASDSGPVETVQFAYESAKTVYGSGGCDSTSSRLTSAVAVLTGLGAGAATIDARLDCLARRCGGSLSVALPGGTTTGAGKFALGDGSVKIMRLAVPSPSRPFLRSHPHAKLKTIMALGGNGSPLVGHAVLAAPAKEIAGLPPLLLAPPPSVPPSGGPTPTPTPTPLSQALQISSCQVPVVGTPTVVAVTGSLGPARGGVPVSLEYVPTSGPAPLPATIVHSLLTDAAGNFSENFDRHQGGNDYSWTATASVAEGGGYVAARSSPCAIPIP